MTENHASDLLHGAAAIAEFMGLRVRQVESMIAAESIPTFRIGRNVCARRSTLTAFFEEKEAERKRQPRPDAPEGDAPR